MPERLNYGWWWTHFNFPLIVIFCHFCQIFEKTLLNAEILSNGFFENLNVTIKGHRLCKLYTNSIFCQKHAITLSNWLPPQSASEHRNDFLYPWKSFDFYMTKIKSANQIDGSPFCHELDEKPLRAFSFQLPYNLNVSVGVQCRQDYCSLFTGNRTAEKDRIGRVHCSSVQISV